VKKAIDFSGLNERQKEATFAKGIVRVIFLKGIFHQRTDKVT